MTYRLTQGDALAVQGCAPNQNPLREDYARFLEGKAQSEQRHGFEPIWMPDFLYDFQRELTAWALRKGRAGIFADCGLGKTPMQLTWAENVCRYTERPVLVLTPLAVSQQTIREAAKFGIEAHVSREGAVMPRITVTNYERLHYFRASDFAGVVLDESSAIKHFTGARQRSITRFMAQVPYRLLCTATAAPNDYIELGTAAEALGELGYMDMLGMFFVNEENTLHRTWGLHLNWRFKRHAELAFWRWVASWARAIRRPSDMGCDDTRFVLPPLEVRETVVKTDFKRDGELFHFPAKTLQDQREERRGTIPERCARVAEMVRHHDPVVMWCHLNAEADALVKMIPDAEQVRGSDSEDTKEARLIAFSEGNLRALVTKPKIGAFGLNWQHCAHASMFPSHSYEQYYQAVRRCWRYGQQRPVQVDIVSSEGESGVVENMKRKEKMADRMFSSLVAEMHRGQAVRRSSPASEQERIPSWP